MARLGIGKLIGGGMSRRGLMATTAIGVGAALFEGDRAQGFMDSSSELLFGSANVDNSIMGTDVGPGELFNPIDINVNPAMAGVGGTGLGKIAGMGWKGAVGVGIGAALATTVAQAIPPMKYINGSMIGDAFGREDKQYTAQLRDTFNTTEEDYYNTQFPGPTGRRRRHTTGATGDIVLGMYNQRLG